MRRVPDHALDRWTAAKLYAAGLVYGHHIGHRLDLADLDAEQVADLARVLAEQVATADRIAHDDDPAAAVAFAARRLARARADLAALHTPPPDHVLPAWSGRWEDEPMHDLTLSVAIAPPSPRCAACAGSPGNRPPWLLRPDRQPVCLSCVAAAGLADLAGAVELAREEIAAAPDDATRDRICRQLLGID